MGPEEVPYVTMLWLGVRVTGAGYDADRQGGRF